MRERQDVIAGRTSSSESLRRGNSTLTSISLMDGTTEGTTAGTTDDTTHTEVLRLREQPRDPSAFAAATRASQRHRRVRLD